MTSLSKVVVTLNNIECNIQSRKYNSGRLFMTLNSILDNSQVARITLDIDDVPVIDNMIILKDYNENEGVYDALLKAGVIEQSERKVSVGNNYGLICFLNPKIKLSW